MAVAAWGAGVLLLAQRHRYAVSAARFPSERECNLRSPLTHPSASFIA